MSGVIRGVDSSGLARNLLASAAGKLQVELSGAGSGGTSSNFGDTFPVAGTAAGFKDSTGTSMAAGNLDANGNLKIAGEVTGTLSTTPAAASTAALTNIAASDVSGTALAANGSRLGMRFVNDADKPCYLKYGITASASSFTEKLFPGEKWEPLVNYTGRVDVVWDAAPTGALRVTELSA